MKFVIHIGMGKTGTSAIQSVLAQHSAQLEQQGVKYFGRWLGDEAGKRNGRLGQKDFFKASDAEKALHAKEIFAQAKALHRSDKLKTFVLSNEAYWSRANDLKPFLDELKKHAEVEIVGYVRDPAGWLPSAYCQWGVVHKVYKDNLLDYPTMAETLMERYERVKDWLDHFRDDLTIRHYDAVESVVADFLANLGVELTVRRDRSYMRRSDAELLLRALVNDRQEGKTRGTEFDDMMQWKDALAGPSLPDVAGMTLDYSQTQNIIDAHVEDLKLYEQEFGIDLLARKAKEQAPIDMNDLRLGMVDVLTKLVISQGARIRELETKMAANSPMSARRAERLAARARRAAAADED
ncbi:hypothetical protein RGQ15_10635 [Paracoccus sp. MBLB3053]|uniref:Sulfotransferase family protein n=1 Tax=Paracoccus aurantius TaxID=3073814 RepID=A0ABU2HSK3_9RHOB|nr:hypothetical protein [Paracoccus sp. MBLB3053]MDS9468021.1 hypothetical protein [Paracoccus sp. MBLB3053]